MSLFQTDNLRVDPQPNGVAVLWLDVAGRSVNVFNRQVVADLEAALQRVAVESALKLLIIRGAKPTGFIAGADIHEFASVRNAEDAATLSATGQRLMDQLANLPIPTLALIHGPCLGGGLEFALACDYRLAIDHPKTQFGLPEIELGLLPGWGGTQRLPRVVGLERALQVILGGRRLQAREALRWGLADAIAAGEAAALETLNRLAEKALRLGKRSQRGLPLRTWRQRLIESNPVGRWLIFRGAAKILRERVPDDMPAPAEALAAVRCGVTQGMEAGLAYEREAISRLMETPACRHLVTLFLTREHVRKPAAPTDGVPPIRKVGIVGAGTMGAGIAQLAAVKGFDVIVQEVNEAALAAGVRKIEALFQKAVERRLLTADEARKKLDALGRTTTWNGFATVDLVIEAVIEDLPTKQAVFAELEKRTRPAAILATNTSSLPVEQLQTGRQHPERIAGLHFFNPVHKLPLVEVAKAPVTNEAIANALVQWAVAPGKTPVIVKDSPGLVVNRILMPYLNEAVLLAAEGMPIEGIDRTIRRFGMPMGPLELLDQVGLDVAASVAKAIQPAVGNRFPVNPAFEHMSKNGWLGLKSGQGFYVYQGKAKKVHTEAAALLRPEGGRDGSQLLSALPEAVQMWEARERMVLLMVNEAAACFGEGIAADAETIDLAMVFGTGWAPHRGGPLHYADDRGLADVVKGLNDLAKRCGPRFEPCAELRRRAEKREAFCQLPIAKPEPVAEKGPGTEPGAYSESGLRV